MSDLSVQLIATEIQALRDHLDVRFDRIDAILNQHTSQIATLNTQMKSLIGNGQPGRIQIIETNCAQHREAIDDRLTSLETTKATWLGKHSVVAAIVATLISLVIATHDHILGWFTHR